VIALWISFLTIAFLVSTIVAAAPRDSQIVFSLPFHRHGHGKDPLLARHDSSSRGRSVVWCGRAVDADSLVEVIRPVSSISYSLPPTPLPRIRCLSLSC